jgi:c-di-GMP-binding flagellar brake protein YcgR
MKKEYVEKRRFQRAIARIPIKYYKVGDYGPKALKASTISRNLSEGGVRFRTAEFVSRACRLVVEIEMPMFPRPIKAISKVAWIRKVDSGDDYEIGNQFLEISADDRKHVSEYVKSLTSDVEAE